MLLATPCAKPRVEALLFWSIDCECDPDREELYAKREETWKEGEGVILWMRAETAAVAKAAAAIKGNTEVA